MKAEGFIWNCILFLLCMFFLYLVYFLYLVMTNQHIKEGYNSSIIEAATFSPSTENFSDVSVIDRIPFIPPKWDESSELHHIGNWNDWYYAMINGAISYK